MRRTDSFGKNPAAGKDLRQENGMTEDEMVGWHHRPDGHESLVCCSPWGRKESDTTERVN